ATLGIVSTLHRNVFENGPATVIPNMIQTSAPINPGNAGGALSDLNGRLAGIPTLAAVDPTFGAAAQGIGFAIPSNRVAVITAQIIQSGKVAQSGRPYLGVASLPEGTPQVADRVGPGGPQDGGAWPGERTSTGHTVAILRHSRLWRSIASTCGEVQQSASPRAATSWSCSTVRTRRCRTASSS